MPRGIRSRDFWLTSPRDLAIYFNLFPNGDKRFGNSHADGDGDGDGDDETECRATRTRAPRRTDTAADANP